MLGLSVVLAGVIVSPPIAHATYTTYLYNDTANGSVVATGSGTLNLNGLTSFGTDNCCYTGIIPLNGTVDLGPLPNSFDVYGTIQGPSSFGSGPLASPNSASGPIVGPVYNPLGNNESDILLNVPLNYTSGAQLGTTTDIFDNTTLAAMGVTNGTYTWTWGSGTSNADSFVLFAGVTPPSPSATPEPSTWVLFGTGILAMMGWSYRKKKALQS